MNIVLRSHQNFTKQVERLVSRTSLFDPKINSRAREIIDAVAAGGDTALCDLAERFDGARIRTGDLRVTQRELDQARESTSSRVKRALSDAAWNIRHFSRLSRRGNWGMRNKHGAKIGEKFDPYNRVGIYVPGGAAPLASTALMTITLAKVAGCPAIVACTPCDADGKINPSLLYALEYAGATEIYRAGGAQAIAAMALGTKRIRQVDKIFGPGNAYVVAAKRLLFGHVSIDLLPGPSEILIIADHTADASFIAADLLAQAEHGSGHERVCLLATSAKLLGETEREIEKQIANLDRAGLIQPAMRNHGWMVEVSGLEEAISITNRFAPEHCEIMTARPRNVAKQIKTAGAIFIGRHTPTALGDYVAGPSHVLPTGGAGRSFSGLTVDQFQRRTSLVEYTKKNLSAAYGTVEILAGIEGLDAHRESARLRLR